MYVDLYTGLSLVQIVRLQKKSPPGQKSAIFSRDRNPFPRCCTCELTQRACFEQEGNGQLVYVDLYTGLSLVQIVRLQKKSPPGQKSAIFSRDRNPFPQMLHLRIDAATGQKFFLFTRDHNPSPRESYKGICWTSATSSCGSMSLPSNRILV